MKVLAVITVVLILVLAWTQNRTIQKSNSTSPPDQALVESGDVGQGQEGRAATASRAQGTNPSRNAAIRAGSAKAGSVPSVYNSAQARQKQAQSNRTEASRNSPGGTSYGEQYQAQSQQRANQQRAEQQRQAQSQRFDQQRASERQRQSASTDHPSTELAYSGARPQQGDFDKPQGLGHEYDNIENTPYRTASRSYLETAGSRTAGDYNQPAYQQATNRPSQESTPGSQSSQSTAYASRQDADPKPEANQSKYQKVSEPLDCIYRDGKAYCR